MRVSIKAYPSLTKEELYEILALRCEVFVVEQECPYQDPDGKDDKAIHVMGFEGEELAAYTRLFTPGDYFKEAAIGRVVTSPAHRGKGFGKEIMIASIDHLEKNLGQTEIRLSAQTYLQRFYEDLGFISEGETYLEDNIPHIAMVKKQ